MIDTEIGKINAMVANEGPYTFDLALKNINKNFPLNMTMTKAPQIAKNSDLILLNFDGLFHKPPTGNGAEFPMVNHTYFPQLTDAQYDQFWIHENMVNSLLSQLLPDVLPTKIANKGISDQIS